MTTPTPPATTRLGRGLRLDDGDLVLVNHGLQEVDGLANLSQALTLRVLTPLGSDPFNVRYGLDVRQAFADPNGIRTVKELIKLNLISTLGTDPRVREVRRVTFDDDRERVADLPDPEPVLQAVRHRRTWTVVAELETVAGAQVTLPVNVEV
jgi:hypothetical protein